MKRVVDHRSVAVAGYAAPWSVAAGGVTSLHLSSSAELREARVVSLDGLALTAGWVVEATGAGHGPQAFEQGSRLTVDEEDLDAFGPAKAVGVEVLLTIPSEGPRTLLRLGALRLVVDGTSLRATVGDAATDPIPLPLRAWLRVAVAQDAGAWVLSVSGGDRLAPLRATRHLDLPTAGLVGALQLGGGTAEPSMNARFARPELRLADRTLTWRFPALLPEDTTVRSDGVEAVPLRALNLPTFCVRSARWDGTSFDPRLVPDHYDAVHLHEDDMGACDWPVTHRVAVPADAPSGVYAVEAQTGHGGERIPFFVRADPVATGHQGPSLLVVLPTATYLAYANEALPPDHFPWVGDDRGHRFARDNGLLSLYDFHGDLSGVSITSALKPMATLREDALYPLCDAPHLLPVDLRLLRFLRASGVAFDVVTDHDLHEQGADALAGRSAVVTGSHPEYLTVAMEEALADFLAGGGSLAYLGGNGFAAAVAIRGDLMELRRGPCEAGHTWDGPLAEQALAMTGEPGGYLRHRGRGEFALVGGAISLMGFGASRPFRRTDASHEPSCAWVFEGVEGDTFGEDGVVLGGAAGYEVDATDPHLGSPPGTVVLARAEGFGDDFVDDPTRWRPGGPTEARARRVAEMTLRRLPAGGLVFSASSVAWCGALPEPGGMNDVGRITLNVLRACAARHPSASEQQASTGKPS